MGSYDDRSMEVQHTVVMFSRQTCGLCDEARVVIEKQLGSGPTFGFREVFIDGDQGLERDYGLRVPVVEVDGREEFEFVVDPRRFRDLVTVPSIRPEA